ncbi:D-hexose-6-phosphate mutarotase [Psychrobium sp. 1_MG-2023]|uniref:D-hexose-6-phosphate mutarotase n=1 Tax=Psychrobium sp. 1_MG-2023 TaxID=3062624 RepID=UPI002734CE6F|nr:D-hexose-6-phosphate mutarotase [Psychrobium sp. 1_MG-2023]MDP2562029.1 D-hexose-6-phosphate mutarotase [Psychrobium sp. 1_MG-2023]
MERKESALPTGITFSDTQKHYHSTQALPLLIIDNEQCQAVISLYGGQILEFTPKGKPAVLWLSPLATFEQGKAIRGGIPICAPWFGAHSCKPYPSHGFARTSLWQLDDVSTLDNQNQQVTLSLTPNTMTRKVFPYEFTMRVHFTLGRELTVEFSVENQSEQAIPCEWALHSYFNVDDINKTYVTGLDNQDYVDTVNQLEATLLGELTFCTEVDRYFTQTQGEQTINSQHQLIIAGDNCPSVITWNPGQELASNMADIGEEFYHQFVCVERGAIKDQQWFIAPGEQKSARLYITQHLS